MNLLVFKKIKKYLKIFYFLAKLDFMIDLQYRVNFIFTYFATSFWLVSELLFIHFLLYRYTTIAGWDYFKMALLIGVNQIWVGGAFYFIIWPSLASFAELIRTGGADRIFSLPISTRFYVSAFRTNWSSLLISVNGLIVCAYSLNKIGVSLSIGKILLFLVLISLSIWIIYCIQFIAMCFTFWLTRTGSILYIIGTIDRLSRFPYEIFSKGILFILFTFVLPIAIICNVPARALIGILEVRYVIYGLIVVLILTILSQIIWKLGLRRYESASS